MPRLAVEGKRVPLNMRTTSVTRDLLEKAAAESGRSLAQEVERIVEDALVRRQTKRRMKTVQLMFRVPPEIHGMLVHRAEEKGVSLNSTLIEACNEYLRISPQPRD